MLYTVLGGSGFIGSHLVDWCMRQGLECGAPRRDQPVVGRPLGHVIYCVGLTADFRARPFDTVEAHVGLLQNVLREADFASLLYLSSARVYAGAERTDEAADLKVNPTRPGDLYNLSKLLGESLCLQCGRPNVRVARLSNVFGRGDTSENFLTSVIRDALRHGRVTLRSALDSAKDYVGVEDVVALLPRIAAGGRHTVYNVASGSATTHAELLETIQRATGCAVEVAEGSESVRFPEIDCTRVRAEFGFRPASVLDSLADLIASSQRAL